MVALNSYLMPTAVILFATLFATATLSSSSSPIENDAQMALIKFLTARVDALQSRMDQLVTQLEGENFLRRNLHLSNAELEKKIHQLSSENAEQKQLFGAKIDLLMAQNVQQDEEINQLKKKLHLADTIQPTADHFPDHIIPDDQSPRLPPSSCRQLSTIGHYLDGIYLVANPDTKKIETVYCDFGSSTLSETLFGSVNIKSQSVHFYVQKQKDFASDLGVITFDVARLNVGGAMDLTSGVFTVPVDGIYYFQFSGLKDLNSAPYLFVQLQVNGVGIGSSYAPASTVDRFGLSGISASLRLKYGDQVRLSKSYGTLDDDGSHYTHFTGWLVEEDLQMLTI